MGYTRNNRPRKNICYLLLKNRRKDKYGELDGNPLNIKHFQELDSSIKESDLEVLVEKGILKRVSYLYKVREVSNDLSDDAKWVLNQAKNRHHQL